MGFQWGNRFRKGNKGMENRSHKGNMCYLVWKNAIIETGSQGGWLKNNGDLGSK